MKKFFYYLLSIYQRCEQELFTINFALFALIAGAILPLAFAPFKIRILAFLSPALLLFIWQKNTPKKAFFHGLLFGLGFFSFGVYWVYNSIHTYGNASPFLAAFITGTLIIALALFIALQGYLFALFHTQVTLTKHLLAFPFYWVLLEWLRGIVLSGFPWLYLGYSQISSPLRGLAPIFGVYGVSFAVALTSGAMIAILENILEKKWRNVLIAIIILLTIWTVSALFANKIWSKPTKAMQVSLIQGNVPQELKWQDQEIPNILEKYQQLTEKNWQSNLIIWPEDAIPLFNWQAEKYLKKINALAAKHNTTIITGIPVQNRLTNNYYNGLMALGNNHSYYLKRHLVPFGEYFPLKFITKYLLDYLQIPMSDFTEGNERQPDFLADNIIIAPAICYEIAYAYKVLDFFPQAHLIVNVSDDSWFGKSIAANQQLEIAQMRSLETNRYQLTCTNTGITAIIRPNGSIAEQSPTFTEAVLTGKIFAMSGTTPWMIFGKYFWWIIFVFGLVFKVIKPGSK